MRIYLILIFFIIFSSITFAQGLQFQGEGIPMENRSSYSVFSREVPHFENEFTINFRFSFHNVEPFGYIFLLRDEKTGIEFNLIYSFRYEQYSLLKFNIEGKDNLISIEIDNDSIKNRTWINFACTLYLDNDSVVISINDKKHSASNLALPKQFKPQLYFGKNKNSVDIPSYSIRNLSVEGRQLKYFFPLNESQGEDVHNSDGKIVGNISSPVWLINSSYYWNQRYFYESKDVCSVNYEQATQTMLFFSRDSLTMFDMTSNSLTVKKYKNELPVDMRLGTSFIDDTNQRPFIYEVNNLPEGSVTMAFLNDTEHLEWIPVSSKFLSMQLHHHSGYFDSERNRYIIFGGFGNKKYNNSFFSYEIDSDEWKILNFTGNKITPRFFQGMAKMKKTNELLIFGGMGNESGDQTVGRRNFYDLYKVNLDSKQIKKLWNLKWEKNNIVPVRDMIILDDSSFCVLCYPEYESNSFLQLYKFSIENGSYEILGDSIPFKSDEIATNANLYHNPILQELYCVAQEFKDDGSSVTYVYSISLPVVTKSTLTMYETTPKSSFLYWWLLILIPFLILLYLLYHSRQKKRNKLPFYKPQKKTVELDFQNEDKPNSIYIFGEFAVYDKKGKDITYMFSPRIKEVLILILQYSFDNGISTQKLSESFWPDKSGSGLKNVRGVTLNHLRKLISELNGIELIFEKGYFKILMSEDCYCDYAQFMLLTNKTSVLENHGEHIDIKNILVRGKFLKSFDTYLFDSFKAKVESTIASLLPVDIEMAFEQEDFYSVIKLSELLFITDPLNEEALYYQIQALVKLKQRDEAKKKYALFSSEYKKVMGENYNTSIELIIKEKR